MLTNTLRPTKSLETTFAGLVLRNPFLLASGPPTMNGEMIIRAFDQGWAGAVTKTLKPPSLRRVWLTREPQPMLASIESNGRKIGMHNIATAGSYLAMEEWQAQIPHIKACHPDRAVIASVAAGMLESDWKRLVGGMVRAGADAVELDVSCSHASAQRLDGQIIGEVPELTARVVGWARAVCTEPIIVKLPAFVSDIQLMMKSCAAAGAAGVSGINTLPSLAGVDLETLEPQPSVRGHSSYGGLSGPAIKPVAMRAVSLMAKDGLLPVSGIGGIQTWQDAAEFLALGATTVQLCTAVMWHGYGLIGGLAEGLSGFLNKKKLLDVSQLIGRANARIEPSIGHLAERTGLVATVIPGSCRNCETCIVACRDGGHHAIIPGQVLPTVDRERCDGCGLCQIVCPHGAMVLRNTEALD